MPRPKTTQETLNEIEIMLKNGWSYDDIATVTGKTKHAIQNLVSRYLHQYTKSKKKTDESTTTGTLPLTETTETAQETAMTNNDSSKTEPVRATTVVYKNKTLDDFNPRDMIKYLYNLGFRIKNNKLVCIIEKTVNLKDIIEN